MDGQTQKKLTAEAVCQAGLEAEELWIQYFGMGGSLSAFEVEAYLEGILVLPALERDILASAANEILEGTSLKVRVPYSGGDESHISPEAVRKALGDAGAFLLTADEAEEERLDSLTRTNLLDTPAEERFDRITHAAKEQFGVSSSIIGLIDDRRQFLKAAIGPIGQNPPRETSFCNTTIRGAGPLIVTDALTDDRFRSNPHVLGEPYIRFYAGYPLRGPGGWVIGTLCVMDQKPRDFSAEDEKTLRKLAESAQHELNP